MRVAVAQISLTDSIEKNKNRIIEFLERAVDAGVRILCFPETALTGYIFDDFLKVDHERARGAVEEIAQSLSPSGLHVILGMPYKEHGALYNSVQVLFPDGRQLLYHKNILVDYEERYFKPGDKKLVFPVDGIAFGVMICRDQNSPELGRELKERGAKGVFISSAHYYDLIESKMKREKNHALPVARAYENGYFVFKANAVGSFRGKVSFGGSMIVDPNGIVVLKASENDEELLTLDIDFKAKNRVW